MKALSYLVLFGVLSTVLSEQWDFNIIYRYHEEMFGDEDSSIDPNTGSLEAHLRTNALGKLFRNKDQSYVEMSSDLRQLHCVPAVPNCTWEHSSNWVVKREDLRSVLDRLQFSTEGNYCQAITHTSNTGITCKCPNGYRLNSDLRTCSGIRTNNYLVNISSGIITRPNAAAYDRYGNRIYTTWLVVAPPDHRIKLEIVSLYSNYNDALQVYDGDDLTSLLADWRYSYRKGTSVQSSGNAMLIKYIEYNGNFELRYSTEYAGNKSQILSLSGTSGSLQSEPFVPENPNLCVYIIYKLEPPGHISVSANFDLSDSLNLTKSITSEVNGWQIGRFTGTLAPEEMGTPVMISAQVVGTGSSIFSISACNAGYEEDVYIIQESILLPPDMYPEITPEAEPLSPQKCYNGGSYVNETKECVCPAGFTGEDCQQACGPNHYGKDCKGMCSGVDRGCKRMIFCKMNLPCMCAPGFTGEQCHISCPSDRYGASCRMPCGHCEYGTCDIYTGECEYGCGQGYYPPLCQDTYLRVSEAPKIEHQDSNSVLLKVSGSSLVGRGTAKFYQVQYKEKSASEWLKHQPQGYTNGIIIAKLTNLKAGIRYVTRVILIDVDGNSNENIGVPVAEFITTCSVPTSREYHMKSDEIYSSGFEVSWQYNKLNSNWCPIQGFEITFRDRWEKFRRTLADERFAFNRLLPGRTYLVSVRAQTEFGFAPPSSLLYVTTKDEAPGAVTDLKATPKGPGELLVSWNKPIYTGGTLQHYQVKYQCLHLLACSDPCDDSKGLTLETAQFVVLRGLHPHAQYQIEVAGQSAELGPFKGIVATTEHTGAEIVLDINTTSITNLANTSFTVQWAAPADCSRLNGYLYGYQYHLLEKSGHGEQTRLTGITEETHMNFTDLTPLTHYEVHIYVMTSGGWSESHKLVIPVLTRATAPEPVQNLTIYKRGRRVIGIRWAAPRESYGPIESFKVTYHRSDEETVQEIRVIPELCGAWPNMYCHTIDGLVPDVEYVVSVQARNTEVDADGQPASARVVTRERAPSAPTSLRVINRTQTSMLIEWNAPLMINGVLRSFLVNVEEIDSSDPSTCCEYYPIQELPVRTEDQVYQLEIGDLRPASTHTISVSAKTVTMGPAVNVTASTPPVPPAVHPPELKPRVSEDDLFSVSILPSETVKGIQSTYLLLILSPEERADPVIWDEDLLRQLNNAVNASFYPVAEFKSESLVGEEEVSIGTGAPQRNGTFGVLQDPVLPPGTYRAGVALVLDYCGAKTVGVAVSPEFEVTK